MNTPQSKTRVPAQASTFLMTARLAAVALLAVLLAPSAAFALPYIYVANAGEDTVSKIDIISNTEVARYATWFTAPATAQILHPGSFGQGPAPSRIVVDSAGNVFVLNRFFTNPNPAHLPVLLKIKPTGGVPGALNNDTSSGAGLGAVLPLTDTDGDNTIDSGEATDVRIVWGNNIGTTGVDEGALGRALCIDPSGVLWVGMHDVGGSGTGKYYRVDATTGLVLPPTTGIAPPTGHMPYGCQVDTQGRLWSVDGGNQLVEINTVTNKVTPHPYTGGNYSLSLFNGCASEPSKVYLSGRGAGKPYVAFDPVTSLFTNPSTTTVPQIQSVSVGVDQQGDIVSGLQTGTGRVIKTDPASNVVVWDTNNFPPPPGITSVIDIHGIIIDEYDDVWAVHLWEDRVVKYSGGNGAWLATVDLGKNARPYTYGNPPPPTCPCAQTTEPQIKCEGKKDGKWLYSWSFQVTNHSPFTAAATTINIDPPMGSPITDLTPRQVTFQNPLSQNGQAIVSGTFTLVQPMPGTKICLDIRLNAGDGWCCPLEHVCFTVPDCACASLQGVFKCSHGRPYLELSVTNLGPTAAAGAQIFSNTPGVTVGPPTTTLAFPQNTPVIVPLTVTGATPGQIINLSVMLHGPIDPRTGVHSWCCTATVKVTYPVKVCWWWPDGEIFEDVNANGLRDSGEGGLAEWPVTLTDAKGTPRTTKSDASGGFHFEEIEPATLRLSVQPPKGWRATTPKGGVNSLSVEAPPKGKLDFGFVKTR